MIGKRQYREMESSCASAPPAREPENIEASGKARERETNTSDPLTAPEARNQRTLLEGDGKHGGMGNQHAGERETAAVRRNSKPLNSAVQEQWQKEAAANRHLAAAGEQPPSSVGEEGRFVPLSATYPKCKLRDTVSAEL